MNLKTIKKQIEKRYYIILWGFLLFLANGCEKFVDINPPNNQLTGEVVFEDASTVNAALADIHARLRDEMFTTGKTTGLSNLIGHYTDEFDLYNPNFIDVQYFYENTVLPNDTNVKNWWSSAYKLIYSVNRVLEGVKNSNTLSEEDRQQFSGEAYFLRAYIHFYLTNLFGDIPYPKTSNFESNRLIIKSDYMEVYQNLLEDLKLAKELLPKDRDTNFRPNHWVASALLARIYLYNGDWKMAQLEGVYVLDNGGFQLETDLDKVFLKDSPETLWQLESGVSGINTKEAFSFIFSTVPPPNSALSSHLINSIEVDDGRFDTWIGSLSDGSNTWYYPYKYKQSGSTTTTVECSILIRLAEIYLIIAEAYVRDENIIQGLNYMNAIRTRASLPIIEQQNKEAVLDAILQERRIELFSEQGHRFFDLKRTGRATEMLMNIKVNWNGYKLLLPLPESELLLNPNLLPQNEGY